MFIWDPTYILVIIGAIISGIASLNVNSTFRKYNRYTNTRGITAEQCAQEILRRSGISDVRIEKTRGNLTDHYSPNDKVLRLSESVYGSTSVAALGVAAHECGHAIQHQVGYAPLKLRSFSVPMANIGSYLSWPIVILGLILGNLGLARIGVVLFMLSADETAGAKKVLVAAAMTYVAALFTAILQLLRLVLLTRNRKD